MIDQFLADLFGTPTASPDIGSAAQALIGGDGGGIGAGGPSTAPMMPASDPMAALMGNDAGGDTMDMSARSAQPGEIPLPRPRPAEAGPGASQPPDIMAMLRGSEPGLRPMPDAASPQGMLGKTLGLDIPSPSKRFQSALAGGMAGGNPAFKGGAFMKGASGGLSGGLKSDKDDADVETARANTAFKNDVATKDLVRKTKQTDALTALYGARTDATVKGKTSTAWNKPPNERWKDAQKLIIDKQKQLYGSINPLSPKAEREAQKAQADKDLATFKDQTYGQYGFSPDGKDIAGENGGGKPRTPSTSKVVGDKEGEDSGLYEKPGKLLGGGTMDDPYMPKSKDEFDGLKPGSIFINPADGRTMTKKAQKTSALENDETGDDTGGEAAA